MGQQKAAISPTRAENYPEWYQQVVKAADMAETSAVRGCMVIKPWGYSIWEKIQASLDKMFKDTGHVNAYFPLFIPLSFFQKEAEHVQGFAKECAVVTHHRLAPDDNGKLVPASPLDEPIVVRPTSETIIGDTYSKWVQSYRDLPILVNQWANVVRWEMRTRMFLRTTEFLWQEGHTVHATKEEAIEETLKMLDVYATFAQDFMAMPVIKGEKTEGERFPGACNTYCIEAMMQDKKALQAGTSHFLGQNFAKAQNIKFLSKNEKEEFAWTTSWGVSTRLIGGLIMTHSDDDGLVLPPKLAPKQIVILPIFKNDADKTTVMEYCEKLMKAINDQEYNGFKIESFIDKRDMNAGERSWQHIKKGVPIRLEVGPRDVASGSVFMGRRDKSPKDKTSIPFEEFVGSAANILKDIQDTLFNRALKFREDNYKEVTSEQEFNEFFEKADNDKNSGGFVITHAVDSDEINEKIAKFKVSARCIPIDENTPGTCIFTGKKVDKRTVFAKSY